MKKEIHPKWHKNAKVNVQGKEVATVGSTAEEINVSIWSGNHPFYTGEEVFVDADNRLEDFEEKVKKAKKTTKSRKNKTERRRARREKRTTVSNTKELTLKDMLKNIK